MAIFALTNEFLSINGVDLSDHVKSATLTVSADQLDTTAMSSVGWKAAIAGLKAGTLAVTFNQDFAASNVDATLWAAFGTNVAFVVKPVNTTTSATNPSYSGTVVVVEHQPVSNSVGELAGVSVTLPTTGAVSRATS